MAQLIDLDSWGEVVRSRKIDVVELTLDHVAASATRGLHSGGKGFAFYGIAVPADVAESHDLHRVATWLLDSALTATFRLADELKIARPRLSLSSEGASLVQLYAHDGVDTSGLRVGDLAASVDGSGRTQFLATSRFERLSTMESLRESMEVVGTMGAWTSFFAKGRPRNSAASPEIAPHFDFTAIQYPMYLDDLMNRRSTLTLAWQAVTGSAPAIKELTNFRGDLQRAIAAAPLEPIVSGLDGRVMWTVLGLRESETLILERYRVDSGLGGFMAGFDDEGAPYEESSSPDTVAIEPDCYHASYVGRTAEGQQYFLTAPFDPDPAGTTDFLALYLFNRSGSLLSADIRKVNRCGEGNSDAMESVKKELLATLGERTIEKIAFKPFVVQRFGLEFGLSATEDFGRWRVNAVPGDYMEFFAPWDSGVYDT